jgi:predicted acetyltransferase
MKNIYIKEDDYSDIDRIDEYNNEYLNVYPNFKPFAIRNNFIEFLKTVEDNKKGINDTGIKEIYYFAIENDKIVGHGSIRLNPEINNDYSIYGHIMYGVVPSKRNKGYGTIICKLLIEKAKEYGINNIIITCNNDNIASAKVIINNNGELFESIKDKENNIIDRYIIKK